MNKDIYYVRYRKVMYCDYAHYKMTHDITDFEKENEISDKDFLEKYYKKNNEYYNSMLKIVDKFVRI